MENVDLFLPTHTIYILYTQFAGALNVHNMYTPRAQFGVFEKNMCIYEFLFILLQA